MDCKQRQNNFLVYIYLPVFTTSATSFKNPVSLKPLLSKPSCTYEITFESRKWVEKMAWKSVTNFNAFQLTLANFTTSCATCFSSPSRNGVFKPLFGTYYIIWNQNDNSTLILYCRNSSKTNTIRVKSKPHFLIHAPINIRGQPWKAGQMTWYFILSKNELWTYSKSYLLGSASKKALSFV